jgi:hypothetical protein
MIFRSCLAYPTASAPLTSGLAAAAVEEEEEEEGVLEGSGRATPKSKPLSG